jgi:hypothetical protein
LNVLTIFQLVINLKILIQNKHAPKLHACFSIMNELPIYFHLLGKKKKEKRKKEKYLIVFLGGRKILLSL